MHVVPKRNCSADGQAYLVLHMTFHLALITNRTGLIETSSLVTPPSLSRRETMSWRSLLKSEIFWMSNFSCAQEIPTCRECVWSKKWRLVRLRRKNTNTTKYCSYENWVISFPTRVMNQTFQKLSKKWDILIIPDSSPWCWRRRRKIRTVRRSEYKCIYCWWMGVTVHGANHRGEDCQTS